MTITSAAVSATFAVTPRKFTIGTPGGTTHVRIGVSREINRHGGDFTNNAFHLVKNIMRNQGGLNPDITDKVFVPSFQTQTTDFHEFYVEHDIPNNLYTVIFSVLGEVDNSGWASLVGVYNNLFLKREDATHRQVEKDITGKVTEWSWTVNSLWMSAFQKMPNHYGVDVDRFIASDTIGFFFLNETIVENPPYTVRTLEDFDSGTNYTPRIGTFPQPRVHQFKLPPEYIPSLAIPVNFDVKTSIKGYSPRTSGGKDVPPDDFPDLFTFMDAQNCNVYFNCDEVEATGFDLTKGLHYARIRTSVVEVGSITGSKIRSRDGTFRATVHSTNFGAQTLSTAKIADIDLDGQITALTDGLLVLQGLFNSIQPEALGTQALRNIDQVEQFFESDFAKAQFDIDGSGDIDPLTDALLFLRYLFGLRGDSLISSAINVADATRTTAEEVEAYIQYLINTDYNIGADLLYTDQVGGGAAVDENAVEGSLLIYYELEDDSVREYPVAFRESLYVQLSNYSNLDQQPIPRKFIGTRPLANGLLATGDRPRSQPEIFWNNNEDTVTQIVTRDPLILIDATEKDSSWADQNGLASPRFKIDTSFQKNSPTMYSDTYYTNIIKSLGSVNITEPMEPSKQSVEILDEINNLIKGFVFNITSIPTLVPHPTDPFEIDAVNAKVTLVRDDLASVDGTISFFIMPQSPGEKFGVKVKLTYVSAIGSIVTTVTYKVQGRLKTAGIKVIKTIENQFDIDGTINLDDADIQVIYPDIASLHPSDSIFHELRIRQDEFVGLDGLQIIEKFEGQLVASSPINSLGSNSLAVEFDANTNNHRVRLEKYWTGDWTEAGEPIYGLVARNAFSRNPSVGPDEPSTTAYSQRWQIVHQRNSPYRTGDMAGASGSAYAVNINYTTRYSYSAEYGFETLSALGGTRFTSRANPFRWVKSKSAPAVNQSNDLVEVLTTYTSPVSFIDNQGAATPGFEQFHRYVEITWQRVEGIVAMNTYTGTISFHKANENNFLYTESWTGSLNTIRERILELPNQNRRIQRLDTKLSGDDFPDQGGPTTGSARFKYNDIKFTTVTITQQNESSSYKSILSDPDSEAGDYIIINNHPYSGIGVFGDTNGNYETYLASWMMPDTDYDIDITETNYRVIDYPQDQPGGTVQRNAEGYRVGGNVFDHLSPDYDIQVLKVN